MELLLAMQKVVGSNPISRSLGSGSTEPQTVSLSEVADFVTASLRVMPRRALDKGYTFRFPELEPALRDLLGKRSTGARLTWHRSNVLRGAGGWLREECVHPA